LLTPLGYYISSEIFIELLECVNYLHKHNIIHRDLKSSNILITFGNYGRFVKLGDFGLATVHDFEGQSHSKYTETRIFTAPEVMHSKYYSI
jgi:serine/threonine protein kinase